MTTQNKTNSWTFDVRVRERNLKSGALTDKDIDKYLTQLPDVSDQSEPFGTHQPALAQPEPAPTAVAPVMDEGVDDDMDDEEEEDEVEETGGAALGGNGNPVGCDSGAGNPENV